MEDTNLLKNSSYLKYLDSLKPEQIAKRYFIANNNAGWLKDIQAAKQCQRDGKYKFQYAHTFIGPSASFLNGLIIEQLEPQLPSNLKVNAMAVAEDIDKFLAENKDCAVEISTDLTTTHDYAVDMSLEMLKTYGRGLKYIKNHQNEFSK